MPDTKIEFDHESLKYLETIRKWAMFLAIIGFIFLGLVVVIGLITGIFLSVFNTETLNSGIAGPLVLVSLLSMVVVYFLSIFFLFRFSKITARAVHTFDKQELHMAIKNLKLYFVYQGLLIIIGLSLYLAFLILTGTSLTFLRGR
jgi:hypothetical protein